MIVNGKQIYPLIYFDCFVNGKYGDKNHIGGLAFQNITI